MSTRESGSSSAPSMPAAAQSQTVSTATPLQPMQTPCVGLDGGHDDVEDVRDADVIAGTDDLDRGLRQRRLRAGSDRELR